MKKLLFSLILSSIFFISCTENVSDADVTEEAPIVAVKLNSEEARTLEPLYNFGFNFFKSSCEINNGNVIVSPLSAYIPLSILANGARGETKDEILEVLGFDADKIDDVNKLNARLIAEMPMVDIKIDFSLANSLWLNNSYDVFDSFVDDAKTKYGANVFSEIFTYKTTEKINKWGKEKTKGQISTCLSKSLDDLESIVCANALYFKCRWSIPFDKEETKPGIFFNFDKSLSIVDMMNGDRIFGRYTETDCLRVPTLYLGNMAYQLTLLLPKDGYNLSEVISGISKEDLTTIVGNSYAYYLNISLPKLELEQKIDAIPILKSMGLENQFINADFGGIFNKNQVASTWIEQNVLLNIDEGDQSSLGKDKKYYNSALCSTTDITFDHPFAFYIKETTTGTMIFAGKVEKL